MISGGNPSTDCISRTIFSNLDLVYSDTPDAGLQAWLKRREDRLEILRRAMRSPLIEPYDGVLIDTQGAVGELQKSAAMAADVMVSPVKSDALSAGEFATRTIGTRRAKTDRLDSDKLLSMLMRYYGGERRVWAVVRVPTPEQGDDRRLYRELERLRQDRTAHTNRTRSLLVLHNLRVSYVGGRTWTHWWARQRKLLAPGLRAEIERECERLALVCNRIVAASPHACWNVIVLDGR